MEKKSETKMPRFDKFVLGVGFIVVGLGIPLTFLLDTEIYQPLRVLSMIVYLVYWYRDKNYKFKYFSGYIGSLIGTVFISSFVMALATVILFGEDWGGLLFIIFLFIVVIFLPFLEAYLYQKFKIMSYINEELKKENGCIREYLK